MSDTRYPGPVVEPEVSFEPAEPGTGRPAEVIRRRRLQATVAVLAAVCLVLAGFLYASRWRSGFERDVIRAIAAYTEAWSAHDAAAVTAAMAPGASFAAGENLAGPLISVRVGREFDELLDDLFAAETSLTTIGEVTVVGEESARATVPQRLRYSAFGLDVVEDGFSLYSLVRVNGEMKVAGHMWWRPQSPQYPSILWLR